MGKHIGTGGLARGKILSRLAVYTWVTVILMGVLKAVKESVKGVSQVFISRVYQGSFKCILLVFLEDNVKVSLHFCLAVITQLFLGCSSVAKLSLNFN